MRRPTGINLIAIWHFIVSVLLLLSTCAVLILAVAVLTTPQDNAMAIIAALFGALVMVASLVAFAIVGWGLWKLKPWARAGAIVLAILQLPALPIGTVIGALTLWYLLSDPDAKEALQKQEAPAV